MGIKGLVSLLIVIIIGVVFAVSAHAATGAGMTKVYKRILAKKKEAGLTWDEIATKAGIPVKSWMTGVPTSSPTDEELRKIAPVLNTTYEYLKYGK